MSDQRIAPPRQRSIDGLKLTMDGRKIRAILDERIASHRRRAESWAREAARTPAEETEEAPLLPEQMCENEAARHNWRIDTLCFVRDHVDDDVNYLLSPSDLEFAELLPEKPGWLAQQEYEERTGIAFNLERLTKRLGECVPVLYRSLAAHTEEANG